MYLGREIRILVAKFTSYKNVYLETLFKVTNFLQADTALCGWDTLLSNKNIHKLLEVFKF